MGGILGHVAIIIGLGTMLGAILEVSGGAEVLSSPAARPLRREARPARHGPDRPDLRHPGLLRRRHLRPRADRLRGGQALRQVDPPLRDAAAGRPVHDPRLPAAAPRPGRRRRTAQCRPRLGHPDGHRRRHPGGARRLGLRRLDRQAALRRGPAGHGRGRRGGQGRRRRRAARATGVTPQEKPGRRSAPSSPSSVPRWCSSSLATFSSIALDPSTPPLASSSSSATPSSP